MYRRACISQTPQLIPPHSPSDSSLSLILPPTATHHRAELSAADRADFVVRCLSAIPVPTAPFRDPRLLLPDPEVTVERLIGELVGGQTAVDIAFIKVGVCVCVLCVCVCVAPVWCGCTSRVRRARSGLFEAIPPT
jgi:hypothetical protein